MEEDPLPKNFIKIPRYSANIADIEMPKDKWYRLFGLSYEI